VTINNEVEFIQTVISGSLSPRHCASCGCGWRRLGPKISTCGSFTVYKNTIHMQPLTAVITRVHVSGGIFKIIILLFQQTALVTGDI
jgi:hypothetical protein